MLQDVSQGSNDNAEAGFELMSEPYHTIYDRSPPPGLGNGIPKEWEGFTGQDGSSLGVQDLRPPLPRIWNNMYSAWNLAFVSAYPDSPFFMSKLLAPIVHLYQEEGSQGIYLWPRVACLYIHMQHMIMARSVGGKGRWPVVLRIGVSGRPELHKIHGDWRSDFTTALFGTANKFATRQFYLRVEAVFKISSPRK